jgi:cytochrome P450
MATELTYTQMYKYWGVILLKRLLTPKHVMGQRIKNMQWAAEAVQRRIARGDTERKDFMHYILEANDDKGMSNAEINVNAFSLNIAGSESSSTLLTGTLFLLLTNPEALARLEAEIRNTGAGQKADDGAAIDVSSSCLPYLDAVVNEALRLYPPVAITMPRRVPEKGALIDGRFVTEGITVGLNHFATSRYSGNFHRPEGFLPERWLPTALEPDSVFCNDRHEAVQPFSVGPRNCLGRNLALTSVKLMLIRVLWKFEIDLIEGQEDWMRSQRLQGFWQKQPLLCRFSLRDA